MVAKKSTYSGFDYGTISNPDGTSTGKITCFPSNSERCTVIRTPGLGVSSQGFVSPTRPNSFHDEALIQLTKTINRAVNEIPADDKKSLHLLITPEGPTFAWVEGHIMNDDGTKDSS